MQSGVKFASTHMLVPAEAEQGSALPSRFSSCCKQASFSQSVWYHIFVLFVRNFTVSVVPQGSTEALFSVLKCRKAELCLPEKERVE